MNYKKYVYLIIVLIFMAASHTGCGKKKDILFCEGVTPEGKGVNCGKKFWTGDLTAVIASKDPFEVKNIDVKIINISGEKEDIVETVKVDTDPEKKSVNATLSFYNGGKYRVSAMKGKSILSEGTIEIVE